jgi:hypothetical protein
MAPAIARWFFGWELDEERGAAAGGLVSWSVSPSASTRSLSPTRPEPSAEGCSPDSIVADRHAQDRVACLERDLHD